MAGDIVGGVAGVVVGGEGRKYLWMMVISFLMVECSAEYAERTTLWRDLESKYNIFYYTVLYCTAM